MTSGVKKDNGKKLSLKTISRTNGASVLPLLRVNNNIKYTKYKTFAKMLIKLSSLGIGFLISNVFSPVIVLFGMYINYFTELLKNNDSFLMTVSIAVMILSIALFNISRAVTELLSELKNYKRKKDNKDNEDE